MNVDTLIDTIPKAELHLHIEGTLEPEMMLALAKRNSVTLPYQSVQDVKEAFAFDCLQDFLDVYYHGMSVLVQEQDFYDLTYAYLTKVFADAVTHVEIFFDPQAHTDRGIAFETVHDGICSALEAGLADYGITSRLIMCFLRHLPEEHAFDALDCACQHKETIYGVGLDSSEQGFPPSGFSRVFAEARRQGFVPVAHAGEEGPVEYVEGALDDLQVQRVDHGNRAFDDPAMVKRLAAEQTPLTMCPLSNLRLKGITDLQQHPIKKALQAGIVATVNSDDPSYFGGYINDNYKAVTVALELDAADIVQLAKNSFSAAFIDDKQKQQGHDRIDEIAGLK